MLYLNWRSLAQTMNTHNQPGGNFGPLNTGSDCPIPEPHPFARLNVLSVSRNPDNFPQHFFALHRRIGSRHCIALSQNSAPTAAPECAMSKKPPVSTEKHDIALGNFTTLIPLDQQGISRKNSREHTPPAHLQPQLSRGTQDLGCQLALDGVAFALHGSLWTHDTF
jgi:hypothetical protein